MEAAKIAAERGRHVVLCEATDHLGGQLIPASTAPYRPGWAELRDYLVREMDRLGIDLRMSTEASPDLAREVGAGIVIVEAHDRPWRARLFHRSVAARIGREAPCSVLMVR